MNRLKFDISYDEVLGKFFVMTLTDKESVLSMSEHDSLELVFEEISRLTGYEIVYNDAGGMRVRT